MKQKNLQTGDILLVPESSPEHGLGHIVRMLCLHDDLLHARAGQVVLAVHEQHMMRPELQALLAARKLIRQSVLAETPGYARLQLLAASPAPYCFGVVVIDRRTVEHRFLSALVSAVSFPSEPVAAGEPSSVCAGTGAPTVVGLDAVGTGAVLCDYVLDGFPRLEGVPGNERGPGFVLNRSRLALPRQERTEQRAPHAPLRVLLSFGARGHSAREQILLHTLTMAEPDPTRLELHLLSSEGYSAVAGTTGSSSTEWRGYTVHCRHFDPGETRSYAEFDLVCTHFGMTAYEAAAEGCAVLLLNPSSYHDRLSRRAGFALLPRHGYSRSRRRRRLTKLLAQLRSGEGYPRQKPVISGTRSTADVVLQICESRSLRTASELEHAGNCPVCESRSASVVHRSYGKTYLRCCNCHMLYMRRAFAHSIRYTTAYFFEEYQKQYGKSYLEDFEHIKSMGVARYGRIQQLLKHRRPPERLKLLDIGCAYGPFMAAVAELGGEAYGVDVAEDAVRYVNTTLGLPAFAVSVQNFDPHSSCGVTQFDAATLWYVIEHFEHLNPVLHRLSKLVRPGGILAFSTPNGAGISARRNIGRFLRRSPNDHYSIWEPARTAGVLARFGFRLEYCVVTGHHPERFPLPRAVRKLPGMHRLLTTLSRVMGLGDTFEAYARRTDADALDAQHLQRRDTQ